MNKKDKATLSDAVRQYLHLKELTAAQQTQMDELKAVAVRLAEKYPADWDEGVLVIEGVGVLKQVNNPPSVTYKHGQPLNTVELVGLLAKLGESYRKPALDITRLRDAYNRGDKAVQAAFVEYELVLNQTVRIDIKPNIKPA